MFSFSQSTTPPTGDIPMPQQSILTSLTKPNPPIEYDPAPSKGIYGRNWIEMSSIHLSKWHDFNLANINDAFGDILSRNLRNWPRPETILEVYDAPDVKGLGSGHLFPLLHFPIAEAAGVFGERVGCRLPTVVGGENKAISPGPGQPVSSLSFRFVNPGTNLVLSCVRVSGAWRSENLAKQTTAASMSPIRQLATYGQYGQTRYTFALTNEEVVVVRIFLDDETQQCRAEWQAIPWNASGDNTLTIGLAIWALVAMSLNSDHRAVKTQRDTLPINVWWRYHDPKGRVIYRHHLSLRERFDLPPGAECRDMLF